MNKINAILITAGLKFDLREDILQENYTTLLEMKNAALTRDLKVNKDKEYHKEKNKQDSSK